MSERDHEIYQTIADIQEEREEDQPHKGGVKRRHPCFGMVRLARVTGRTALFGSDIEHNGFIELQINEAEETSELGTRWYFPRTTLIRVRMSYAQFVNLMGNMNTQGVPCTIAWTPTTGSIKTPERMRNIKEDTERELRERVQAAKADIQESITELTEILERKKSFSRGDMEKAITELRRVQGAMEDGRWHVEEAYKEEIERVTHEAKVEADAYLQNAMQELGQRSLAKAIMAGDITPEQLQTALEGAKVKMLPKAADEKQLKRCPNCGTEHYNDETLCTLCVADVNEAGLTKPGGNNG